MQLEASLESFVLCKFGKIESAILYRWLIQWLEADRRAIEKAIELANFLDIDSEADSGLRQAWEKIDPGKREEILATLARSQEKSEELGEIPF
jgi:hypothetical protein